MSKASLRSDSITIFELAAVTAFISGLMGGIEAGGLVGVLTGIFTGLLAAMIVHSGMGWFINLPDRLGWRLDESYVWGAVWGTIFIILYLFWTILWCYLAGVVPSYLHRVIIQ